MLALVEIKARFDEQANISWARKLEQAGVHVVYGIVGLKTHCKLVARRPPGGRRALRRYCHVGTGNYNPKTARLYEDLGLLTADPQVGEDLTRLFNQLSGYAPRSTVQARCSSPRASLRAGLIERIEREIAHAQRRPGAAASRIKVNSIVDEAIIDALYRASQAGVPVDVLGARHLRAAPRRARACPRTSGCARILGRFLEHSRVFVFGNGGDAEVYIGSADMMHRNLDRRVEALVRITDPAHVAELQSLHGARHERRHRQLAARRRRALDAPPPRRRRPAADDLQSELIEMHTKRRRKARRR